MSMGGGSPKTPDPIPPPAPPAIPAPDAPIVGDKAGRKGTTSAARTGTRSLRTDLMIVPSAATLGGAGLNGASK